MKATRLTNKYLDEIIERALAEDLAYGDITTDTLIPDAFYASARLLVEEEGVLAGVAVAGKVFLRVDPSLEYQVLIPDGKKIKPGDVVATVAGRFASILKGERTALNFIQRLSGIATLTARYVRLVRGTGVYITDTRKTTPGLRMLEKYAVRMGGGKNHRMHLGDAVLIKDNHLAALRQKGIGLKEIIRKARQSVPPDMVIEVEVVTVEEAREAAEAGADIVMLDNMNPDEMRRAAGFLTGKVKIEASGGINLENIRAVAETGITYISVGALTHSYRALDISLETDMDSCHT